jgi:hypothetical protein
LILQNLTKVGKSWRFLALSAVLLSGCGGDPLAPVVPPPPDLTTVQGAIVALEDFYSRQKAENAIELLGASYKFVPALPESIPFLEPAQPFWFIEVEKDILGNLLVPERVSWIDQVLLEVNVEQITTTPEGLVIVNADVELGLLIGANTWRKARSPMQLTYGVDAQGNHLLIEEREFLRENFDPLLDVTIGEQKVSILPPNYTP